MPSIPVSNSKIDISPSNSIKDSVKYLFSPFRFKGLTLKNRIVLPALASFMLENDGSITEKTVNHYRLRAAGGPAMVVIEACAVSPEGIVSNHQAQKVVIAIGYQSDNMLYNQIFWI
jgi:hypothetical protein